jgi:hypothetical protein
VVAARKPDEPFFWGFRYATNLVSSVRSGVALSANDMMQVQVHLLERFVSEKIEQWLGLKITCLRGQS